MSVFSFSDYKDFLNFKIQDNAKWVGYKGRLAEAAGCQRAYLSQVMSSHVHLTPEHALGLTSFWSLQEKERDFFLELVSLARAGTHELKRYIEQKLSLLRATQKSVSGRIDKPKIESYKLQAKYYSSWHYSAVHILLTISRFETVPAIAKRLNISDLTVTSALDILSQIGLARNDKGKWKPMDYDLHLPRNSPFTTMNHQNWRSRALLSAQSECSDGLHFTSVYSLSEADFLSLKELLLQFLSDSRDRAIQSKEEDLFSFTCDLFRA